MHTLGPRPISDDEARELAEVGLQNAEEHERLDTLVALAELVTALTPEQRITAARQAGLDFYTFNELIFRAEYLARSKNHGRTTLERETSANDNYTLAGDRKATIRAADKNTHRRAILIRIEDDGTGPTINAYPELIDVRGFTITSDTPAATLHLKYDHITSNEALTKLLQDALEEEA